MGHPVSIRLGAVEIELCYQGEAFLGVGQVTIDGQPVRSGEMPLRPFTATHDGIEYDRFVLERVEQQGEQRVVLHTRAQGVGSSIAAVQDHSLDPVWNSRRWDQRVLAEAQVAWIFQADARRIGDHVWTGFSYSFAYDFDQQEIYYVLDRATWELDGQAVGITLLRQQMGEDPLVTLQRASEYSTAACIPFPLNPIMTYDVPRWSSEQGFDYQYRDNRALIGVFDHCGLIRTIVVRNAGDDSIRHFDKHIFDQSGHVQTVPKFIGVALVGDATDQLNAWTQVFDADQDNVLGEFGMQRTYPRTTMGHNFWVNFTYENYLTDLLPAAAALGFQQIFIDPCWENDMTRHREGVLPDYAYSSMCCPHEYEIARVLGGVEGYRKLVEAARAQDLAVLSWIGSHQSRNSPYLHSHQVEAIKGPDGRHRYGSGYDDIYGMDLASPFGPMFREAIARGAQATGIGGFLYDSFFNFGWMPVNFHTPDPADPTNPHAGTLTAHTQWRQLAETMAVWQRAGLHMLIESLGPWGQAQHGVQGDYRLAGGALAYQCAVCTGYSTIPTPGAGDNQQEMIPDQYFRLLAHKAPSTQGLWLNDHRGAPQRLDRVAHPLLRAGNLAYRALLPRMHTRTILPQDSGVFWQDRQGHPGAVFSFGAQRIRVPGATAYRDLMTGQQGTLDAGGLLSEPWHAYEIIG